MKQSLIARLAAGEIGMTGRTRGGKRAGAGRPPAPPRPKPISWRPDTQAQRDKWLELGGARWIKRILSAPRVTEIDGFCWPTPSDGVIIISKREVRRRGKPE